MEALDLYLRTQALQDLRRLVSAVFVITPLGQRRVLGYCTLSALSLALGRLALGRLPLEARRKLPRYPEVPVTLLGRLAVDRSCRGAGIRLGEHLLVDALRRSLEASAQVASYAVVVDVVAGQPDPIGFYLRYGFQALPDHPRRLFLPIATIRRLFET